MRLRQAFWSAGSLAVVAVIAMPIREWMGQGHGNTNRDYLVQLMDRGTLEQTARAIVSDALAQTPQERQHVEELRTYAAHCLKDQAAAYLASGDSYLSQPADRDTPTVLALRFMTACGLR
jgi:GrpB-like predicted nucleotidyltransferase (UPF0157 family)